MFLEQQRLKNGKRMMASHKPAPERESVGPGCTDMPNEETGDAD